WGSEVNLPLALLQAQPLILAPGQINSAAINDLGSQLAYLGPLLTLVGAVLLILLADVCLRLLRIRKGLPPAGSLIIGLLGALASGLYAGWFIWKDWDILTPIELFSAVGAPGSSAPASALISGYAKIPAWSGGALVIDSLGLAVCAITSAILIMTF